ncbi:MAG: ribonucleoside triphosphate reductase, partial [Clostridia bacterium]|nr:ribonucleoside triphosphate reductase [Clostridia bacterium]
MFRVNKRDGKIVDFEISKISGAIKLAFEACERNFNDNIIDFLALKVTSDFEPKIENEIIAVEDIQDSVETVLVQAGYADVAK